MMLEPMMIPMRQPMASHSTASTISTAWARLTKKPRTALSISVRLPMHPADLDADRQVGHQLGEPGIHALAQLDHIDARLVGDGERDRRPSVIAHHGERRIAIAEIEVGEVADPDEVALALRVAGQLIALDRRGLDEEVGDRLRERGTGRTG